MIGFARVMLWFADESGDIVTRVDAKLAQNDGDVGAHRAWADGEPIGDLLVRESQREKPRYLPLAGGQSTLGEAISRIVEARIICSPAPPGHGMICLVVGQVDDVP